MYVEEKTLNKFSMNNNIDCQWGNPGVAYCLKPIAFDDIPLELHVMASLTICHINIVSLCKNLDKLVEFFRKFPKMPEIICLSEIRTNQHNVVGANLPGYCYYRNNSPTKAGGSGVYVINSLICTENLNLRTKLTKCGDIWVEILLSSKILQQLVVCTVTHGKIVKRLKMHFTTISCACKENNM